MSLLQIVLLAVVQGITEFLPISSSAHLILASWALGWPDQGLAFDIATHVGSWLALVVASRRELWGEVLAWRQGRSRLLGPLVVGTLPVLIGGLLFHDWVGGAGRSPLIIAVTTIVFGAFLWWGDRQGGRPGRLDLDAALGYRLALLVGLAQAVALIPGVSRSGVTITAALLLGLSRPAAARFSFLLAIPVGAAVGAKDLVDIVRSPVPAAWGVLALALVLSALSAWAVIRLFLAWIEKHPMTVFVWYRFVLGAVIFGLMFARGSW